MLKSSQPWLLVMYAGRGCDESQMQVCTLSACLSNAQEEAKGNSYYVKMEKEQTSGESDEDFDT